MSLFQRVAIISPTSYRSSINQIKFDIKTFFFSFCPFSVKISINLTFFIIMQHWFIFSIAKISFKYLFKEIYFFGMNMIYLDKFNIAKSHQKQNIVEYTLNSRFIYFKLCFGNLFYFFYYSRKVRFQNTRFHVLHFWPGPNAIQKCKIFNFNHMWDRYSSRISPSLFSYRITSAIVQCPFRKNVLNVSFM